MSWGGNPWEGIFWNKKVSKYPRHPVKFGYGVHSGSQEEKTGGKKMKLVLQFFPSLSPVLLLAGREG